MQQMLLGVHKRVLQIAGAYAAAGVLAAVHPGLGDSVHPQLQQSRRVILRGRFCVLQYAGCMPSRPLA